MTVTRVVCNEHLTKLKNGSYLHRGGVSPRFHPPRTMALVSTQSASHLPPPPLASDPAHGSPSY